MYHFWSRSWRPAVWCTIVVSITGGKLSLGWCTLVGLDHRNTANDVPFCGLEHCIRPNDVPLWSRSLAVQICARAIAEIFRAQWWAEIKCCTFLVSSIQCWSLWHWQCLDVVMNLAKKCIGRYIITECHSNRSVAKQVSDFHHRNSSFPSIGIEGYRLSLCRQ